MSKLENYLGLAKRSNSLIFGFDNIKSQKNKIFCIILCKTANDKQKNYVDALCKEKGIEFRTTNILLDELLKTTNCKVVGIINKNFVKPILESEE